MSQNQRYQAEFRSMLPVAGPFQRILILDEISHRTTRFLAFRLVHGLYPQAELRFIADQQDWINALGEAWLHTFYAVIRDIDEFAVRLMQRPISRLGEIRLYHPIHSVFREFITLVFNHWVTRVDKIESGLEENLIPRPLLQKTQERRFLEKGCLCQQ